MFSRCCKSFVLILITTMPLVYSSQITYADKFPVWDDNFTDLYQQAPTLVLNAHNSLRAKKRLPELKLKKKLNRLSKEWAETLAKNREFYHEPHSEYGENIYWENYQSRNGLRFPGMFVKVWADEEKFFRKNMRFHELSRVSNFTQLIWRSTQYLGVAAVTNDYNEVYLVCKYDPPGNVIDEYLNNIDLDRVIPELETNLHHPPKLSSSARSLVTLSLMSVIMVAMSIVLR